MARTSDQSNDTQQLLICNIRSAGTKRIFAIIGVISVLLVFVLFSLLSNSAHKSEENNIDRHKRSTIPDVVTIRGYQNDGGHKNMRKYQEKVVDNHVLRRKKRQSVLDPVDSQYIRDENVRKKREHLQQVQAQFEECRHSQADKSKCDQFYREMLSLRQALNFEIGTLRQGTKNVENPTLNSEQAEMALSNHKMSELHGSVRKPSSEINREGQKVNEFTPFPRFHEEMDSSQNNLWTIDEPANVAPEIPMLRPPPSTPRKQSSSFRENEKISPLKTQSFDPSGQILQLCDQISRQSPHSDQPAINTLPGPTSSGFVTNNAQAQPQPHNFNQNFQPNQQVTQQFGMPQVYAYRPNPVCIIPQQMQPVAVGQNVFVPQQQFVGPVANSGAANRFVLVNSNAQQFASTSPSGQGFVQVAAQPMARSEDSSSNESSCSAQQSQNSAKVTPESKRAEQGPDPFFDSFASRLTSVNVTNPFNTCEEGQISCVNANQCIPSEKWCDNVIDCIDSSDETTCTCASRLNDDKLCDGYLDCPLGSDEIGCFGCDKRSYSCYNNADEYQQSKFASNNMCFTLAQKCDGFHDCLNGKDEEDCSMLVKFVGLHTTFMVPYTEGILYRNFRGRWYPVCEDPVDWAKDACESEMGDLLEAPQIQNRMSKLPGPFISRISRDEGQPLAAQVRITNTCPMNQAGRHNFHIRVKCPPMKCGTVKRNLFNPPQLRIRDEKERKKREEYLRIVGGDRSGPHSWPYIVALYKDGRFHCGATIFNEFWVISAAHCASKGSNHYYEVHAGLLRRFSYAPEVQIAKVVAVIVNDGFDRREMQNDVSLFQLEKPLLFNRWVRPICLPSPERVTSRFDPNWMEGPPAGTICTVVGWGALAEKGSSPDNLEEVNVPIMKNCKSSVDIDGNEICAGEKDGGHDACQGDSGGPLICRSKSNPEEFYLAGIVSHGEGCARRGEPGVYTRVALFVEWIEDMINSDLSRTAVATKTVCPGFTCTWSSRCISKRYHCNGQVDCLGGEDELNCAFNPMTAARKRIGRQNSEPKLSDGKRVSRQSGEQKLPGVNSDIPKEQPEPHTTEPMPFQTTETHVETTMTTTQLPLTLRPILTTPEPDEPAIPETTVAPETTTIQHIETGPIVVPIETTTTTTTITEVPPVIVITTDIATTTSETTTDGININEKQIFVCTDIKQNIDIKLRCNMQVDCEDGTDEKDCPCVDTLKANEMFDLICNGEADCMDLSDEQDCNNCKPDEYVCRKSNQCVAKESKCDGIVDCTEREDEDDCVALTDGKTILMDADLRPTLNYKGILCENVRGAWSVKCVNRAQVRKNTELAGQTCTLLGFSGYSSHNVLMVDEIGAPKRKPSERVDFRQFGLHSWDRMIPNRHIFKRSVDEHRVSDPSTVLLGAPRRGCFGLYVECVPHTIIPIDPVFPPEATTIKPIEITTTPKPIQTTTTLKSIQTTTTPKTIEVTTSVVETTTKISKPVPPTPSVKPIETIHQTDDKPTIVVPFMPPNDTNVEIITDNFAAPWAASVYVDGDLACIGVLLGQWWVLAERSCVEDVNMDEQVIQVILGHSKNPTKIQTPSEQNIRVDCLKHFHTLKTGSGLHLERSVQFSRYILPTYVPLHIDEDDTDCVAVSHGPTEGFVSIPVVRNDTDCPNDKKNCYQAAEPMENIKCDGFDGSRYGVIVCRSDNNTYYPIGLIANENGLCSLEEIVELELLEPSYNNLQLFLTWHDCRHKKENPKCSGHRCPLGECIEEDRVCDKKADCRDGSDETIELCKAKNKCLPHELQCGDGSCVLKTKFCDKVADCEDKSDEPEGCTCFQYLELTDQTKICDGIPNCHDKSDETNECPCRKQSFRCTKSNVCIPPQFVCDGQSDCPHGDDEKLCYGAEEGNESSGYYRVIERSAGEWQTKCLKKTLNPTQDELKNLCTHLGYVNATNISYKLLDPEQVMVSKYQPPVKVISTKASSTVRLNDHFKLNVIQPSPKIASYLPWNATDNAHCNQLLINCGE